MADGSALPLGAPHASANPAIWSASPGATAALAQRRGSTPTAAPPLRQDARGQESTRRLSGAVEPAVRDGHTSRPAMPTAPDLWTWITIPAIGGLIGLTTNWLAVKMIFRPIKPRRLLLFKLHGLVPRRQAELAKAIGRVVGEHLVGQKDVLKSLNKLDFGGILGKVLDQGLAPKIEELRSLPLIGGFLTEGRIADIKQSITNSIMEHRESVLDEVEKGLSKGLDVPELVATKVAAFEVLKLERLILEVANRELRAIVMLGGVLGVLIGLAQVGFLWLRG